jgi:hypothetical protein
MSPHLGPDQNQPDNDPDLAHNPAPEHDRDDHACAPDHEQTRDHDPDLDSTPTR